MPINLYSLVFPLKAQSPWIILDFSAEQRHEETISRSVTMQKRRNCYLKISKQNLKNT